MKNGRNEEEKLVHES